MKLKILFQSMIIVFLLIVWLAFDYWYNGQKEQIYKEIGSKTIIVYSYKSGVLSDLQSEIKEKKYIKDNLLEKRAEVVDRLIDKYNLESAAKLINTNTLPDILHIFPDGQLFNKQNKDDLWILFKPIQKFITVDFDDEVFQGKIDDLENIKKIIKYSYYGFAFIVFFIVALLRIFYEKSENNYWRIFFHAGGKYYKRTIRYILSTILIILISAIILAGMLYYVMKNFDYNPNYKLMEFQVLVLISSYIISKFFIKDRVE